jgi:hypothetical protein
VQVWFKTLRLRLPDIRPNAQLIVVEVTQNKYGFKNALATKTAPKHNGSPGLAGRALVF